MKLVRSCLMTVVVLAGLSQAAQAAILASNTIVATDSLSGGVIEITSRVHDNYLGDFGKYLFEYEVLNVSYEPTPLVSNGLSGFNVVFHEPIAAVADQFAPPDWFFNCCGTTPPFGAEADIDNSSGVGITIGTSDLLGFTVPAGAGWTDALGPFGASWGHSWESDVQVNVFDLVDTSDPTLTILTPLPGAEVPAPGTMVLLALGLLGASVAGRRRSH